MLPDRIWNPGPLTCESGALPIALRGPAEWFIAFPPENELHHAVVGSLPVILASTYRPDVK